MFIHYLLDIKTPLFKREAKDAEGYFKLISTQLSRTMQWQNLKNKQQFTKTQQENQNMSNTNPKNNLGVISVSQELFADNVSQGMS